MNKKDLMKLALIGMASGLCLTAQASNHDQDLAMTKCSKSPTSGRNSCGNGSCGGEDDGSGRGSCGSEDCPDEDDGSGRGECGQCSCGAEQSARDRGGDHPEYDDRYFHNQKVDKRGRHMDENKKMTEKRKKSYTKKPGKSY